MNEQNAYANIRESLTKCNTKGQPTSQFENLASLLFSCQKRADGIKSGMQGRADSQAGTQALLQQMQLRMWQKREQLVK